MNPLIQAEISVLVDVIRAPYALFPETSESRSKFLHGTFVHKYVASLYYKQLFGVAKVHFKSIYSNYVNLFKTFSRLINHATMMLIKQREKQLNFHVLNVLADYARATQHKQILHCESKQEVVQKRLFVLNFDLREKIALFSNNVVV